MDLCEQCRTLVGQLSGGDYWFHVSLLSDTFAPVYRDHVAQPAPPEVTADSDYWFHSLC